MGQWGDGKPPRDPTCRVTPQSLDSLGTSEDTRSKRHSTSDLSDVTFSDVRKEGWLHYKQILTKKGKVRHGGRGKRGVPSVASNV